MSNIKYLRHRQTQRDGTVWIVDPPKYVKDAVGAAYEVYTNKHDAVARAVSVADAYQDYKRTKKRQIYIQEASVGGLVAAYKQTNSWNKLSANTKRTYDQLLRGVMRLRIGGSNVLLQDMLAHNVKVPHAEAIYAQLRDTVSMHRANHTCKVLRRVWFVGVRLGSVRVNPFEKMGMSQLPDREVLWEPDQVWAFINKADELGWASLGTLALLCYDLCQRPGDMRQLTWEHFSDGRFKFTQEKTKNTKKAKAVSLRASKRLLERIGEPATGNIVVAEDTQEPYDRRRYNKIAARIRREAELPNHLQLRDLRRTGATEMAEAGCTEDQLRSVTGHQSRDVLSIYVRPTDKLADEAMNKRFNQ